VFNFKQNTLPYIAENDMRPAIDFKIIRLAHVRFEFETPVLENQIAVHIFQVVIQVRSSQVKS
jgi:hypothetical protein